MIEKIKQISQELFKITGVRSYARADFLVTKNKTPSVLELNTLPGLTKTSLLPKSASFDGISFKDLIKKILELAQTDYKE